MTTEPAVQPQPLEVAPLVVQETKPGYKTTEFWAALAVAILDVVSQIPTKDKLVVTLIAVGYAVARGLAKAGVANVNPPA